MKTHLSTTLKFSLFFTVAFLALQATFAAAADSGSGTFVGTISYKPATVTFKDVYAYRAEDSFDKTKEVTVVYLSESPLDKKTMTDALRKEPARRALTKWGKINKYLDKMTYVMLELDENGKIKNSYLFSQTGVGEALPKIVKSEVKINTMKRVEGSLSGDEKGKDGDVSKIDLRFATDLVEIGPPGKK